MRGNSVSRGRTPAVPELPVAKGVRRMMFWCKDSRRVVIQKGEPDVRNGGSLHTVVSVDADSPEPSRANSPASAQANSARVAASR
jgi:hypothetical protein